VRRVPDWTIQTAWWISGIFATGAVWYFLSVRDVFWTITAAVGAALFACVAIALHLRKDADAKPRKDPTDDIVLNAGEETVRFTEMVRSLEFDIVKVHAHTHMLGVMAEHEWIRRRYPGSKLLSQSVTTLERLQRRGNETDSTTHFDVMKIELTDKREKKIYFDISSFFTGRGSLLDPASAVAQKLNELYKSS
jgi:hypothetical protein